MKRTTKKERENNARHFYALLQNRRVAAVVIERNESTTNPYVKRCRLLTAVGSQNGGEPMVIAESPSDGVTGCFFELMDNLGFEVNYDFNFFNNDSLAWLRKNMHINVKYSDNLVILFEYV